MTTEVIVAPDYLRQRGFFDPERNAHAACTFIGVGGIGSFASFAVAKLGIPRITLIDPDVVEPHNLPSQMFDTTQAFDAKVEAAVNNILVVAPEANLDWYVASAVEGGWEGEHVPTRPLAGVVISGLDSMKARADLWRAHLRYNARVPLYIDGRIDGQQIVLYAIKPWDPTDVAQYEATLLSDDEVPTGSCTERAIIDVGFTIGAQVARLVRRHYSGEANEKITVINQATNAVIQFGWTIL